MYQIDWEFRVHWVPDGAAAMTQPSAQTLILRPTQWPLTQPNGVVVTATYPVTQANFRTAISGSSSAPTAGVPSMFAQLDGQIAAALPQLLLWTSGGG